MPERRDVANPAIRDAGAQGVHELGGGFRLPANPAAYYEAEENRPQDSPAFEHPNPTGAPNVQRSPHPEREQPARTGSHVADAEGVWLNSRHALGVNAQGRITERSLGPDRPAMAQVAMTVRPFDHGMGRSEWAGGLHGVVPIVDGSPTGRQATIDVQRPTFRVPPRPWEESIRPIGG